MSEERKDLLKKVGIVLLLLLLAIGSFVTIFTVATRDEEPEEEAPIVEVLPEKEDEEPENKITSVPKPEFTDTSFVYDGKEHSPDVKASAFYAVSFKSSTTKAKDAGSYKIVYKLNNPDDVKWEDGTTDDIICEWSIEPKEVGLKWGKTKFAFDGKEHSTTCVISGVLEGDKCDIVLKNNSISTVGQKTVSAVRLTNNNYKLPSKNTTTVLTMTATTLGKVTFSNGNVIYDGSYHTVGDAKCETSGVRVSYSTAIDGTYLSSKPVFKDVGTYKVYAKVEKQGYTSKIVGCSYIIKQKEVGLDWGPLDFEYDGKEHSTTCKATGVVSGDTCSVVLSGNSIKNVGRKTVTATSLSNKNYKLPANKTAIMTMETSSLGDITVEDGSPTFTYDGKTHTIGDVKADVSGVKVYYSTKKDGTYSTTKPSYKDVGKYTVYMKVEKTGYETENLSAIITIEPREAVLKWGDLEFDYDGKEHSTSCVVSNLIKGDTCSVMLDGNSIKEVGSKTVKAISLSNKNYELPKEVEKTLTVKEKELLPLGKIYIEQANKSVTYDGKDHEFCEVGCTTTGVKITYSETENGTYTEKAPSHKDVGEYTTYVKFEKDGYKTETKKLTLTIKEREVKLEWGNTSWVYDGEEHSTSCTVSNVVEGDDCGMTIEGNKVGPNVGSSIAVVKISNKNYKLPSNAEQKIEITTNEIKLYLTPSVVIKYYDKKPVEYNIERVNNVDLASNPNHGFKFTYSLTKDGEYTNQKPEIPVDVGEYVVYIKAEKENYDTTIQEFHVSIKPDPVGQLWWGETSFKYDGEKHSTTCVAYGTKSGEKTEIVLENNSVGPEIGKATVKAVGTVNPNCSLDDAFGNMVWHGETEKELEIISAELDVKTYFAEKTYDGTHVDYGIDNINGKKLNEIDVNSYTITWSLSEKGEFTSEKPEFINAGSYVVYAKIQMNGYEDKIVSIEPFVAQREANLVWMEKEWVYDKKEHTAVCVVGNCAEDDECNVILENETIGPDVDAKVAKAVGLSNANYVLPETGTDQEIKIIPAGYSIEFFWKDFVYDGKTHTDYIHTFEFFDRNDNTLISGDLYYSLDGGEYSEEVIGIKNAGKYSVSVRFIPHSENYVSWEGNVYTITIKQKPATLKWGDLSWDYDGKEHSTTCVVTNLCGDDICEVELENNSIGPDSGKATVKAVELSNPNYCLKEDTEKTMEIIKSVEYTNVVTGDFAARVQRNIKEEFEEIVFDSVDVPNNVDCINVSTKDGGVVAWVTDKVLYVSTIKDESIVFDEGCSGMFANLSSVKKITFKDINTSNVKNMDSMFSGCTNLVELDLTKFEIDDETEIYNIFGGSSSVFNCCSSLKVLDISNWNVCDKRSWRMFNGLSSLETIYCNHNWFDGTYLWDVFGGNTSLKGAISYDVPIWNSNQYANPTTGYFTAK